MRMMNWKGCGRYRHCPGISLGGTEESHEKSHARVGSLQTTNWTRDLLNTELTNYIRRFYTTDTEASSILITYIRRTILMLSPVYSSVLQVTALQGVSSLKFCMYSLFPYRRWPRFQGPTMPWHVTGMLSSETPKMSLRLELWIWGGGGEGRGFVTEQFLKLLAYTLICGTNTCPPVKQIWQDALGEIFQTMAQTLKRSHIIELPKQLSIMYAHIYTYYVPITLHMCTVERKSQLASLRVKIKNFRQMAFPFV
jgi:hypothetical protein